MLEGGMEEDREGRGRELGEVEGGREEREGWKKIGRERWKKRRKRRYFGCYFNVL